MSDYRELLLGCGFSREKRMSLPGRERKWSNLTTLDICEACEPDILANLDDYNWPNIGQFDEIHAYEVLEHIGKQGYAEVFFRHFSEIYRLLKPNGHLLATTPSRFSPWLWGDPSHRRVILPETLAFLDRRIMHANAKRGTSMSNFDRYWKGDFKIVQSSDDHVNHVFILQALKPIREFS